ncbi:MAG: GTPase Era [bacterium]|nr:GTPase Era [bacterium]
MKGGIVALVGRPNVGKSTLLNQILKQKVSITSPKPQTTRRLIQAAYEDQRGQIIFTDTPGIFAKVQDRVASKINKLAVGWMGNVDLILYMIDKTRSRGPEENRILGIVRQSSAPKILVYNKIDIKKPDYSYEYKVYEEEFDDVVYISALKATHIKTLLAKIFDFLPEISQPLFDSDSLSPTSFKYQFPHVFG